MCAMEVLSRFKDKLYKHPHKKEIDKYIDRINMNRQLIRKDLHVPLDKDATDTYLERKDEDRYIDSQDMDRYNEISDMDKSFDRRAIEKTLKRKDIDNFIDRKKLDKRHKRKDLHVHFDKETMDKYYEKEDMDRYLDSKYMDKYLEKRYMDEYLERRYIDEYFERDTFEGNKYSSRKDMDLAMFNQIAQINDHLFLSSAGALKADRVRTIGITNVVNCTMEIPNIKLPNLECIQIHVEDTPSARLGVYFDRCADKIHQVHRQGGKVLVHCVAGVSRSASLCIAYLMKYQKMTLEQAYYHVKKRRPVIHPNVGFWRQLIEYERRLFGRNTVKMVPSAIGPIPDVYKEETRNMVWRHTPAAPRPSYSTTYSQSYRHGY